MPRSRILVAVSTPWASDRLVETVRDLARRLDAAVVVAHVAQSSDEDKTEEEAKERGQQTLSTLTSKLAESGINADGVLLFGDDIARAVINAAEANDATLIAIGASGKGRMARLLAGDVPQQVMRLCARPLLVFPPDWSGTV